MVGYLGVKSRTGYGNPIRSLFEFLLSHLVFTLAPFLFLATESTLHNCVHLTLRVLSDRYASVQILW
eukprot:SAG22_NODE_7080_length_779_cov_0.832353_1_plen_67_part_00